MTVALVVLLPVLSPGFALRYDLLFVPKRDLSLALLGVTEEPPRQVPIDFLVGAASWILRADWLEKILLGAVFVAGAVGAGRLVPTARWGPRIAAGLLFVWNPFVYERLSIGQWSLLLSYALLPWVGGAALAVREAGSGVLRGPPLPDASRRRILWSRLGLWLGAASLANPYGGLIAGFLALAIVSGPPWRRAGRARSRDALGVIALTAVVSLPWLIPALLRPSPLPDSPQGLRLFAARSDSPLGVIGSVLSLGGMWNTPLASPGRAGWSWVPSFALVGVMAVWGWRWSWRRRPSARGIVWAGAFGLIAALGIHVPVLGSAYRWVALNMPGGALLRDSQKFVALLALAFAVGFGCAVEAWTGTAAAARRRSTLGSAPSLRLARSALVPLALCLVPLSIVPAMAWGLGGRLSSVSYPRDWITARDIMMKDAAPGRLLVLPWRPHVPLRWNEGRITLNPARAFFTRPPVTSDRLELRRGTLPPETPGGAMADALVRGGRPFSEIMQRLGVRYLLVLKEADWRRFDSRLKDLDLVMDGSTLALYRWHGPIDEPVTATPPEVAVVGADVVTVVALALLAVGSVRRRWRPRISRPPEERQPTGRADILQPHEEGVP